MHNVLAARRVPIGHEDIFIGQDCGVVRQRGSITYEAHCGQEPTGGATQIGMSVDQPNGRQAHFRDDSIAGRYSSTRSRIDVATPPTLNTLQRSEGNLAIPDVALRAERITCAAPG